MNTKGYESCNSLINNILVSIPKLNKCRKQFIIEVFTLFLTIRGRINFLQLERFGASCEQRYRQQFEKSFPFLDFNTKIIQTYSSQHNIIAFDPSYISKSGTKTPGLSRYWSGCAGKAKWGLEISELQRLILKITRLFILKRYKQCPPTMNRGI